jgi:hypothetical protein
MTFGIGQIRPHPFKAATPHNPPKQWVKTSIKKMARLLLY